MSSAGVANLISACTTMLPEVAKQLQISPDPATLAKYTDLVTNINQVANAAQAVGISPDLANINKDKIVDELKKTASSFASFGLSKMADFLHKNIDNVVAQAPGVINQAISTIPGATTGGFVFNVAEYAVYDGAEDVIAGGGSGHSDDIFNVIDFNLSTSTAGGDQYEPDIVAYDGGDEEGVDIVAYDGSDDVVVGAHEDQLNYELLYTGSGETEKCYVVGANIKHMIKCHKTALDSIKADLKRGIKNNDEYYKNVLAPKMKTLFKLDKPQIIDLEYILNSVMKKNPIGWFNNLCPLIDRKIDELETNITNWMKTYAKQNNWPDKQCKISSIGEFIEQLCQADYDSITSIGKLYNGFGTDPGRSYRQLRDSFEIVFSSKDNPLARKEFINNILRYNDEVLDLLPQYNKILDKCKGYDNIICSNVKDNHDINAYYKILELIVNAEDLNVDEYLVCEQLCAKLTRCYNEIYNYMQKICKGKTGGKATLVPMRNFVESLCVLNFVLFNYNRNYIVMPFEIVSCLKSIQNRIVSRYNISIPEIFDEYHIDDFVRNIFSVKI